MNTTGLQNRAGELMKEVEKLLMQVKKIRKLQSKSKLAYESAMQKSTDLQAMLYVSLTNNEEVDWEHPQGILDSEGVRMPEFEAQWQSMLMNTLIQENETNIALGAEAETAKVEYYTSERDERTLMEAIGVKKSQMGLTAALLRLEDGS